jgi:EpsI family protein
MTTRHTILALAAAAFAVCFAGVLGVLATAWVTNEVYSYGLAVLLISVYLIWTRSDQLRRLPAVPDYRFGVPVTLAGIAMLVTGRIGLLTSLQETSLVVTLAGFILLFFGRAIFACVWFPLAYLLLGFPIWDMLIGRLQPPSQLISGRIAAVLLHTIGIPVLQDGTKLALPNVTLEVLRECSGVNQLLAIVAMALPASYIWLRTPWRRVMLVSVAILGAYASNGVRIALVGFLATRGLSNGDLRGVHLFEGLAVSSLCYLLILTCLSALSKTEHRKIVETSTDAADAVPAHAQQRPRRPWLEVGLSVTLLSIGVVLQLFHTPDVRLRNDLRAFPERIGEWSLETRPTPARFPAIDDELVHAYPSPEGERHFTAIDDELVRAYRNASGERVRLYIGYHRSQREGKELAGEASHLLNAAATPVLVQVGSHTVELSQIVQVRSGNTKGLLYWYDLNGRVLSDMYLAKKYMVWDALTRRRTNGAVVMVEWESRGNAGAESLQVKAAAFVQALLPLLPKFIPS